MQIFQGCRCGNCQSVMFPFYFDLFDLSMKFMCPRGCTWGEVVGIYNKIPSMFINKWLMNFFPGNTVYKNFCWNCKKLIVSRTADGTMVARDTIWSLGFVCDSCKESLRGLMLRDGFITNNQVDIPPSPRYVGLLIV